MRSAPGFPRPNRRPGAGCGRRIVCSVVPGRPSAVVGCGRKRRAGASSCLRNTTASRDGVPRGCPRRTRGRTRRCMLRKRWLRGVGRCVHGGRDVPSHVRAQHRQGGPTGFFSPGRRALGGDDARSGGLRPQDHECFAERVLAARLAVAGARIGRARGAVVEHMQNASLRAVQHDSHEFCRDEVATRVFAEQNGLDPELHLEPSIAWDRRLHFDSGLNRSVLLGLARLGLHAKSARTAILRAIPGYLIRGVTGRRGAARHAALRARVSFARFALMRTLRNRPAPAPVWDDISRASMLRALAGYSAERLRPEPLGSKDLSRVPARARSKRDRNPPGGDA